MLLDNNGASPWDTNNYELQKMYLGADSGECPFTVTSTKELKTQSCGNSRFGCWVCTVVKVDKSLKGFIESGEEWLIPLAEFREFLLEIRDSSKYRDTKRRDGSVYWVGEEDKTGFGPFLPSARYEILEKLLELDQIMKSHINEPLISIEELRAIDKVWCEEFDFTQRKLVELYARITGSKLPWDKYRQELIDENSELLLKTIANQNELDFELIQKLLLFTHKNKNYKNRNKLRNTFKGIVNQDWLSRDTIKEIHDDLKETNTL